MSPLRCTDISKVVEWVSEPQVNIIEFCKHFTAVELQQHSYQKHFFICTMLLFNHTYCYFVSFIPTNHFKYWNFINYLIFIFKKINSQSNYLFITINSWCFIIIIGHKLWLIIKIYLFMWKYRSWKCMHTYFLKFWPRGKHVKLYPFLS